MFELPAFTVFVMIAVPAFWVLYTVGFLIISRNWSRDDDDSLSSLRLDSHGSTAERGNHATPDSGGAWE